MIPRRVKRQAGRHALVDGIPFALPVNSDRTSALMAAFEIDAEKAPRSCPATSSIPSGSGVEAVLLITVINYR